MGARWEWESFHQEWDGTGVKILPPCRPLPPTPPLPGGGTRSTSSPASPMHGPRADYISRLSLLAITAADAVADRSGPPSGKSLHPAPSPKRTCSALTRRSSQPNSKKKINMQMCDTDVRRNSELKVAQRVFFFFFLWTPSETSLQTALRRGVVSSARCAQA